jgi:plastocyanin
LFVQLLPYSASNGHIILGKSSSNQSSPNQLPATNRSEKNNNTPNISNATTTMIRLGNKSANNNNNNTNSTISQMSTTEANKTTNANAASPFPPRMSNTTGFFPPNNKAEIVKGAALLREKAYQPNPARVKAGGSITWTNLDTVVHTITSGKGITDPAMGTKFDSGMLGGSFAQRFFKPGTYPYFCQIHPTMVGTVIVK